MEKEETESKHTQCDGKKNERCTCVERIINKISLDSMNYRPVLD